MHTRSKETLATIKHLKNDEAIRRFVIDTKKGVKWGDPTTKALRPLHEVDELIQSIAEMVRDYFIGIIPKSHYTINRLWLELLKIAISEINYYEVAEGLLEEVEE